MSIWNLFQLLKFKLPVSDKIILENGYQIFVCYAIQAIYSIPARPTY